MQDYPIQGKPDLTLAEFATILRANASPALPEAEAIYQELAITTIHPSVWLGFFFVESKMGNLGIVKEYNTKNAGNVRTPEDPANATGIVQTPRGPFAVYATWANGAYDWGLRMRGPKYAGAGLTTVREVVPKYAPSTDGNYPEAYAATVLAQIEKWTGATIVGNPLAKFTTFQDLLPPNMVNNPDTSLRGGSPNYITVHEVGNLNPQGGTARATRNYVHNGGGQNITTNGLKGGPPMAGPRNNVGVSFQAVVGDTESFQLLPWNMAGYHAGDGGGDGNYDSIGIETQQVGDWFRTIDNLAALVAHLMKEWALPIERVVQHNHWSGKNCPQYLRSGTVPITGAPGITWAQFIAKVQRRYNDLSKGEEGEVREPAAGEFTSYQNARGETLFVWNAGGKAVETVGINVVDLGLSVRNEANETYDRSIQHNVAQQWSDPR